jgi:predicted DNA-binding ribbon-helix-helix protein
VLPSLIVKRSVVVHGHKTSVSLEAVFWRELKAEALQRKRTLSEVIAEIDHSREHSNLSSACRCHVLARILANQRTGKW